mmetsp:Transcript_22609/g.57506  ORF Transcript_22609/g.57506 Transcript_22609/m.57506 type:complete len:317 (+) Transcript_22609:444-1394(+)
MMSLVCECAMRLPLRQPSSAVSGLIAQLTASLVCSWRVSNSWEGAAVACSSLSASSALSTGDGSCCHMRAWPGSVRQGSDASTSANVHAPSPACTTVKGGCAARYAPCVLEPMMTRGARPEGTSGASTSRHSSWYTARTPFCSRTRCEAGVRRCATPRTARTTSALLVATTRAPISPCGSVPGAACTGSAAASVASTSRLPRKLRSRVTVPPHDLSRSTARMSLKSSVTGCVAWRRWWANSSPTLPAPSTWKPACTGAMLLACMQGWSQCAMRLSSTSIFGAAAAALQPLRCSWVDGVVAAEQTLNQQHADDDCTV